MHSHILQTDKRNPSTTSPASSLSTLLVMNGSIRALPLFMYMHMHMYTYMFMYM